MLPDVPQIDPWAPSNIRAAEALAWLEWMLGLAPRPSLIRPGRIPRSVEPLHEAFRHTWHDMVRRCRVPSRMNFKFYGGRGITVCDRWADSFEAFIADVGTRPIGLTLDRIDNARGYEPGNVRWATHRTQCRNRRSTKLTIEDARAIRARRAETGESYPTIARDYGVAKTVVAHIVRGLKWREDVAA